MYVQVQRSTGDVERSVLNNAHSHSNSAIHQLIRLDSIDTRRRRAAPRQLASRETIVFALSQHEFLLTFFYGHLGAALLLALNCVLRLFLRSFSEGSLCSTGIDRAHLIFEAIQLPTMHRPVAGKLLTCREIFKMTGKESS